MSNISIYTGVWTDQSRSGALQKTLTLTTSSGYLLIVGLVLLVALTEHSAWNILSYFLHRSYVTGEKSDGTTLQCRVILRNSGSTLATLGESLRVLRAWTKAKGIGAVAARRPRLIQLIVLSGALWFAFVFAGFTTSLIADTGDSQVLIAPGNCGTLVYNTTTLAGRLEYDSVVVRETLDGRNYARNHYNAGSVNNLTQSLLPVQSLFYASKTDAACPFDSELCILGENGALTMDTGLLDSQRDFGINAKEQDRVKYRKVVTCSPIHTRDYAQVVNGTGSFSNTTFVEVYFGPTGSSNYTYVYNTQLSDLQVGYQLTSFSSNQTGTQAAWYPIPDLAGADADVSVYFLTQNRVQYLSPVDDPWFQSNQSTSTPTGVLYDSNYYITAMGCVDEIQICDNAGSICTLLSPLRVVSDSLVSYAQQNDFNTAQLATTSRLLDASYTSRTVNSVYGLDTSALLAQDLVFNLLSPGLPSTQWQSEVQLWFTTSLAKLQTSIVKFVYNDISTLSPYTTFHHATGAQCSSQRIQRPSSVSNFSILGIAVLCSGCGAIILTSALLDPAMRILRNRFRTGAAKQRARLLDDQLVLLHLAWQRYGAEGYENAGSDVPIALSEHTFSTLIPTYFRLPVARYEREGTASSRDLAGVEGKKGAERRASFMTRVQEPVKKEKRKESAAGLESEREEGSLIIGSGSERRVLSRAEVENYLFHKIDLGRVRNL